MSPREPRRRRLRRVLIALLLALALVPVALILPLRWVAPPVTAFMLEYRYGARPARAIDYRWVDWEDMSPWLPLAAVAAEDQKFPQHFGFDLQSIHDAIAAGDERTRGASTISQQTVKNLYLWPGRSLVRKGLEAWLTVHLELLWPKRRILEVYLNVAELGPGVYGVGAASRRYFRKTPAQLGAREAAALAAVLPSPGRYSVTAPSAYVRARVAWIQGQMGSLGGPAYLAGL
jgi:monofunctional biosynthetic peptidoglycan transglycosylase